MKGEQVLFSSASEEWETPQALFDALDSEFHFNLDVSANESNRKCERFFSKDDDGLSKNWGGACGAILHTAKTLVNGLKRRPLRSAKMQMWS